MLVNDEQMKLDVWCTAELQDFDFLRPLSYPEANVFLVCVSVASAASFQPVKAVTITGCFKDGLDNQRTWSSVDIWLKRYLRIRTTFESITRIPNLNSDQTDSATRVNTVIAPSLWITR